MGSIGYLHRPGPHPPTSALLLSPSSDRRASRRDTPLQKNMRRIIYGISLWAFLLAAALTISSIALPNWITYTAPTSDRTHPVHVSYGLHKRCSSISGQCLPFPQSEDCLGEDRAFCSMWRSTGFLMNFAVVVELACLVAYVTVLVGGRMSREDGWKVLSPLLGLCAVGQAVAMALVPYLYEGGWMEGVESVVGVVCCGAGGGDGACALPL